MENQENKVVMSYASDDANVNFSFSSDNDLEGYIDYYKRFLLSCGFHPDSVKEIRYGDDDMCMIRDRVKSALDILESVQDKDEKIESALRYLNEAYDM